jgi:glycosyltransferase involved in cell wall biosynthesis
LRIALVVPGGVDRSGERRVIPALLALLERLCRRHEVQVFALRQEPRPGAWDLAGARIHNIGDRWTRMRAIGTIYGAYRAARPAVVHAIFSGSCGLVAVASAALLRVPSLVHVGGSELAALPAIGYGDALRWQGRLREALVLRAASAITAASEPVVASLARLGLPARRVPLGVDLEAWPPREPRPRSPDEPARLIHVASLNRVKDQGTMLAALALLANEGLRFEMDIVGEDTLGGEVQAIAARLGLLRHVRFRGFLPQRQLRPLVEAAHLMIICSRHETGPLAVLEAAAVGVPSVGTDVGHIAEWSPQAAMAVPVGDAAALARALARMLADEQLRLNIARKAHELALREDADYTAARFEDLYRTLAGRR